MLNFLKLQIHALENVASIFTLVI